MATHQEGEFKRPSDSDTPLCDLLFSYHFLFTISFFPSKFAVPRKLIDYPAMGSPETVQSEASRSPTSSGATTQVPSESSTRSSSPFMNLDSVFQMKGQANPGNNFWVYPLDNRNNFDNKDASSRTPGSSPPYTRQGSVVDFEQKPYTVLACLEPNGPYHVFSHRRKWAIVILIGIAGLFSGLSSNIYFPALDAIAKVSLPGSENQGYHGSMCEVC